MQSFKQFMQAQNERVNFDALPGTYLGRLNKDVLAHREIVDPKKKMLDLFKSLKWSDITFNVVGGENTTRSCYAVLPEELRKYVNLANLQGAQRATPKFGDWAMVGNNSNTQGIMMKYESANSLQRSHFPNGGIPRTLRGLGVGPKLYRALLHNAGYLRSNSGAKEGAQRSWLSMVKNKLDKNGVPTDEHVLSMMLGDNIFAIDPSLSDGRKVELAKNFLTTMGNRQATHGLNFDVDPLLKALLDEKQPRLLARFYGPGSGLQFNSAAVAPAPAAPATADWSARIAQYVLTDENDHSWEVGDYIVVKAYLRSNVDLPVRRVIEHAGGAWTAIRVVDVPRYAATGSIAGMDVRTTRDKSKWTKAKTPAGAPPAGPIDDSAAARVAAHRGTAAVDTATTGSSAADAANQARAAAIHAAVHAPRPPAVAPDSTPAAAAHLSAEINIVMHAPGAVAMDTQAHDMDNRTSWALRDDSKLYVDQAALASATQAYPVFSFTPTPSAGQVLLYKLFNLRTGAQAVVTEDDRIAIKAAYNLVRLETSELTRKTDVAHGDHVFMSKHRTLFGLVCPVSYTTRAGAHTARQGQESVYVVKMPGARTIQTKPSQLLKVVVSANEGLARVFESYDQYVSLLLL